MKLTVVLLGLVICTVSAKMPGFDIYVGDLVLIDNQLEVSHLKALTNRVDYHNQPLFLPDGNSLLYTAALTNNKVEQTDSMLVSLKSGQVINLTNSCESEYSPTLMPTGKSFSVIRAVNDQQKLWRYSLHPKQKSSEAASK
jgi:Tol biopolymer transport system component